MTSLIRQWGSDKSHYPNYMFSVIGREELGQAEWDAFVDASDEAWLWHRFDAQDVLAARRGRNVLSFAIRESGGQERIVAIVPLHLVEGGYSKLFSVKVLDSFGGVACLNDLGSKQKKKVLDFVREQFINLALQCKVVQIDLRLTPMAPAYRGEQCPKVNPLLHLGVENRLTQTYVIDLQYSKEELWDRLLGYCRTHIRKAEKEGFVIREADSFADVEKYYGLHLETYYRTGVEPHPFKYFEHIWRSFTIKGYSKIFLAERDGELVAADNEAFYKKGVVGWTAAGKSGATKGINNLLHWHAIRYFKERGFEWYESGEAFPAARGGKNKGLNDFKKSFGGELYPYYRGEIVMRPVLLETANWLKTLRQSLDFKSGN